MSHEHRAFLSDLQATADTHPPGPSLPALAGQRGVPPLWGAMETESAGGPCSPNVSLAASSRGKRTGREAPKADPVGPQSSGRLAQGSSGGGVSRALPTPGPHWLPPLVLPEAEGAPPSGAGPRGLSTLCRSTGDIRNRTRRVQRLVIYRKREGLCLLCGRQRGACPCGP